MKRGADGSSIGNLIALIVLFMVLYIVILPTSARESVTNTMDELNPDSIPRDITAGVTDRSS